MSTLSGSEIIRQMQRMEPQCPHCRTRFETWSRAKIHVKYCDKGSSPRRSIAGRFNKGENEMSIKDEFKKKGADAPPLLHGSDLPKKVDSVVIIVKEIRTAPDNFSSIAIIDFTKPVYEKESFAVNKTNMRALMEKLDIPGDAEMYDLNEELAGKKITLTKVMVNNPKTNKMGPSLFVA
jgi:hypothetical protein